MIYTNHIICVQYTSQDFDQIISFLPFPLTQFLIFLKDHVTPQLEIIPQLRSLLKQRPAISFVVGPSSAAIRHGSLRGGITWWCEAGPSTFHWAIHHREAATARWCEGWSIGPNGFLEGLIFCVFESDGNKKKRWYNYEVAHIF